ncbi:MAG: hypothetical protein Q8L02_04425, partial [Candidatus Nitrotoga sp.]|nr:hypothetical protein [Candidatus Nitrotoga sp.]
MHQRLLAANNLTLAHIARGAPLAQTLACIVNGIEDHNPKISGAILLLSEDGNPLHLGAAPSLDQDYSRVFDDIATDVGVWADQHATDIMIQSTAKNVEAGQFWRSFRDLALQHGLYVCSMIPIRSSTNCMLGIFVAY